MESLVLSAARDNVDHNIAKQNLIKQFSQTDYFAVKSLKHRSRELGQLYIYYKTSPNTG